MNRYHNSGMCMHGTAPADTPRRPAACASDQIIMPAGGSSGACGGAGYRPDVPDCGDQRALPLAIAAVRDQDFTDLLPVSEALCRGTMFRGLDKPFIQGRRVER